MFSTLNKASLDDAAYRCGDMHVLKSCFATQVKMLDSDNWTYVYAGFGTRALQPVAQMRLLALGCVLRP